jgi:hypothetical protein
MIICTPNAFGTASLLSLACMEYTTPNEAKSQHQTNQPKPASQQPATSNQHTGHWQPTNTEEAKMLLDRSCCWTDGGQAMTSSMSTIAKLSKKKQFLSMVFIYLLPVYLYFNRLMRVACSRFYELLRVTLLATACRRIILAFCRLDFFPFQSGGGGWRTQKKSRHKKFAFYCS